MPVSHDLELSRSVRRIFVKHWVDLGRISIRCTSGRVHLFGTLLRVTGKQPDLQANMLNAMFYELKRIKGVKTVNARLDNWILDSGKWRAFERHDGDVD
ncbi:MAG: hypothetical protein OSB41_05425 [Kiritimatiellae bacterium]|nr:hypothetical protein [Kiritimatiellia bacterium]